MFALMFRLSSLIAIWPMLIQVDNDADRMAQDQTCPSKQTLGSVRTSLAPKIKIPIISLLNDEPTSTVEVPHEVTSVGERYF